jgi:hypothetical protein
MNPKIKELAEFHSINVDVMQAIYDDITLLIVRECICQCDDENSQKYIMSHFGFTEKDWS